LRAADVFQITLGQDEPGNFIHALGAEKILERELTAVSLPQLMSQSFWRPSASTKTGGRRSSQHG